MAFDKTQLLLVPLAPASLFQPSRLPAGLAALAVSCRKFQLLLREQPAPSHVSAMVTWCGLVPPSSVWPHVPPPRSCLWMLHMQPTCQAGVVSPAPVSVVPTWSPVQVLTTHRQSVHVEPSEPYPPPASPHPSLRPGSHLGASPP